MKKVIGLVIIMLLLILGLAGWVSTYYLTNELLKNQIDRFIEIKTWMDKEGYINGILYDKETLVEYWKINGSYGSGLTVLLDAEGKPILYKEGE